MDYLKHYERLIDRARKRTLTVYSERHHIIPKSIGGSDGPENLVRLTPEEHFLAHQLLVKIHPGNPALVHAAMMMCADRPMNKVFGWMRRRLSEVQKIRQSGENNSQYGKMWINNGVEATRIMKDDTIPEGWVKGRSLKRPVPKEKIPRGIESDKYKWIPESHDQIIKEFQEHRSIDRILKDRGFTSRVGNTILSKYLKEHGFTPLRRRNTQSTPASHSG